MNVAVLGAGVSGLTAARLLADAGYDVTLYEKEHTVGGLARTRFVEGYLYDPHGGHAISPKIPRIVDWIFSILPREKWQYSERIAKIYLDGRLVSYPFELALHELDVDDAVECVYDFIMSRQGGKPENFRDWIYWNFGRAIADRYMIPYNEKIWAYPLEQMETHWMRGKMPLTPKKELLRSILTRRTEENEMPHSTFYYPIDGGIQSMVDAINSGFRTLTDAPVEAVEREGQRWTINGDRTFDAVISTIPLPVLGRAYKGLPQEVAEAIAGLKYNSLNTVLFSCPRTDINTIYIPSHGYRPHRVIYQSTQTPHACPNQDRAGCGALEIIGARVEDPEALVRGKAVPEELGFRHAMDMEFTEYAYVIHDLDYRENTGKILRWFEDVPNFYLLGRWGTWNYKNMDLCMLDAMELVERHFPGAR